MKRLRLKIWVEDEDGKIKSSQLFAGGLPHSQKPPNEIWLDWTDDSREIDCKVMLNAVATLLKAKFGDSYIEKLPLEYANIRAILDK